MPSFFKMLGRCPPPSAVRPSHCGPGAWAQNPPAAPEKQDESQTWTSTDCYHLRPNAGPMLIVGRWKSHGDLYPFRVPCHWACHAPDMRPPWLWFAATRKHTV